MKILLEHTENREQPTGIAVHQKNLFKIINDNFETHLLYDNFDFHNISCVNIFKLNVFKKKIKLFYSIFRIYFYFIFKISLLRQFKVNNCYNFPKFQNYLNKFKKDNIYNIYGLKLAMNITTLLNLPISLYLDKNEIDIVHCPFLNTYNFKNAYKICTIHDTIPFDFPDFVVADLKFLKNKYTKTIETSDLIFTVSQTTKNDILKHFNVLPEKIFVTYQTFIPPKNILNNTSILQKYNLEKGKYFIFYGAIEPKKNIINLIKGYLKTNNKKKLLIVGSKGWKNKIIFDFIDDLNLRDKKRVIIIGHTVENDLYFLLQNSNALLFPSLAEGFGLPVLEAMFLGVPCVISNIVVFKELYNEAALFVDPYSITSISNAIDTLENEFIINKLKSKMKIIIKKYSRERYLSKIKEGYDLLR